MSLSDTQLQLYGLPTHAVFKENLKLWTRILANAKYHSCSPAQNSKLPTGPSTKSGFTPNTVGCNAPGDMCPNTSWAGNEAVGSRGTYKEADTEFFVPSISTSVVGSHVSLWAGVGGDPNFGGSTVLVQAGVDVSVDSNHHQYNVSWWEVVPGFNEQNLPFTKGLHIGDDIAAIVHSNSSNYPNQDAFFLDNFTTHEYINKISSSLALSDSASAEWTVERVSCGNHCLYPLAQFQNSGQPANTVRLYGNEAETNGSSQTYSVASLTHLYNQIYVDPNNLNTLMADAIPNVV
ncbi:MAG: G1 family endopeptidase [Chloroflexota bacterium]|nr:G1 family endopeptidase [Chloroflexota bacterium]